MKNKIEPDEVIDEDSEFLTDVPIRAKSNASSSMWDSATSDERRLKPDFRSDRREAAPPVEDYYFKLAMAVIAGLISYFGLLLYYTRSLTLTIIIFIVSTIIAAPIIIKSFRE